MTAHDAPGAPGALHHVELYVSDLDRAVRFWSWLLGELGYDEFQRWDGGRSWKLGPTYLVVVEAPEEHREGTYHRCAPGLNHLAFHASSRERVDELTLAVRDRGLTVLYEDEHPHAGGPDHYALYFEAPEPEWLKVEFVAP
jgi:catechol 2,3-dioxygenase-like lactoylglutathione lyase family enzyme